MAPDWTPPEEARLLSTAGKSETGKQNYLAHWLWNGKGVLTGWLTGCISEPGVARERLEKLPPTVPRADKIALCADQNWVYTSPPRAVGLISKGSAYRDYGLEQCARIG